MSHVIRSKKFFCHQPSHVLARHAVLSTYVHLKMCTYERIYLCKGIFFVILLKEILGARAWETPFFHLLTLNQNLKTMKMLKLTLLHWFQ